MNRSPKKDFFIGSQFCCCCSSGRPDEVSSPSHRTESCSYFYLRLGLDVIVPAPDNSLTILNVNPPNTIDGDAIRSRLSEECGDSDFLLSLHINIDQFGSIQFNISRVNSRQILYQEKHFHLQQNLILPSLALLVSNKHRSPPLLHLPYAYP